MKVLFGIPVLIHREISIAEVDAMAKMGVETETSDYGNSGCGHGFIKSAALTFKNAWRLKKKMLKQQSDIIFLNSSFDEKTIIRDAITVFLLRLYAKNIKLVLKLHGRRADVLFRPYGFIAKLKAYLIRNVDLLLVLSTEERNDFLQIGTRPEKLKITANSIDRNLFSENAMFRYSFVKDDNTLLLLFVGRLIKEKGIHELIDACASLKQQGLKYKLICLGDGPEKSRIMEQLKFHDLQCCVTVVGHIPEAETKAYYANCDILVLPSYSEGFPMAVFQAIAAGKPVITTQISGSADHLQEGVNCLWCQIGNSESIVAAILKLGKDKKMRTYMQQNNLLLAEKFTQDKIAAQILNYLKDLLQSRSEYEPANVQEQTC